MIKSTFENSENNSNNEHSESAESNNVTSWQPYNEAIHLARKVRRNIHSNFYYLKNKLNLTGFKRKTQIDSLLKKCKSKAFRTIHEALKNCLKIKLLRLPQPFITNIKIDINKSSLNKSILDIYAEHGIIPSFEEFENKGFIIEGKSHLFKDFLSLTFREVFEKYLDSQQYIKDYKHISKREGEGFALLFNYISKIYITYYDKSRGNKHQKLRKNCKPLVTDSKLEHNANNCTMMIFKDKNEDEGHHLNLFQINRTTRSEINHQTSKIQGIGKKKKVKVNIILKKNIFEIKKQPKANNILKIKNCN